MWVGGVWGGWRACACVQFLVQVAYRAGLRVDDQIRAVNGQECTNMAHHEVVGLIRKALAVPQVCALKA